MDVGIIIALKEELREFIAQLPAKPTPERDPETGLYGYIFEHPVSHHRCVVTLIGEMNPEPAALQTERLLSHWAPRAVVMLGIAAGIHPDVRVGDVVIANQVDHYLATAKAQAGSAPDSFEFSLGGTVFHADFNLLTQIRNFEFFANEVFSRWQQECAQGLTSQIPDEGARTALVRKGVVREAPDLLDAHLASGSVVGASQQFIQWLRNSRDRNLKALDMESAGLMVAAVRRTEPARTLIIRGISDYGDERKAELDGTEDGALRRHAMRNATRLLWALLEVGAISEPSERAGGREVPPTGPAVLESQGPTAPRDTTVPRYPDEMTRVLSIRLEDARSRKALLQAARAPTGKVDQEIRDLRRQIREGGQLRAGDSLGDGRFLLLEAVGEGGFAIVWRARDRTRDEDVAIKVLHTNLAGSTEKRERFFRGARHMAELQHPAVVGVVEKHGEDGGYYYFVMNLIRGTDFRRAVLEKQVSSEQILPIIIRVGDALALAHSRGIIHRDVKPSNILLNGALEPLLTDFDLVGAADTTGGTRTGVIGTVVYAAPECLSRPQDADARADVYSLGMTTIFGLMGEDLSLRMVGDMGPALFRLNCPPPLERVLRRATYWEVHKRYRDAGMFVSALRRAIAEVEQAVKTSRQVVLPLPEDVQERVQEKSVRTAQTIIEKEIPAVLRAAPQLAKDIGAIIHFDIPGEAGGVWTLDLTKSSDWVTRGALGQPKMTIHVDAQDLVRILQKQLNAQMAAMQGKLKFKPMDMSLAMKLAKLLNSNPR